MRSSKDPIDFLIAVAKKKPQLQALIDDVFVMSYEDIEALSQPLWIREALRKYKEREGNSPNMYAMARLAQVIAAEEAAALLPPKTYEVRIWDCASEFIGNSQTSSHQFSYEIHDKDAFMLLEDDYIKIGSTVIYIGPFDIQSVFYRSKLVGYMTKENYMGFHQALINQKHKL